MNWQQLFQQPKSPFSPRGAKRAQSFVEFALTLPLMLLMVSAAVEWGQIITAYNRVQIAAREGARFGAAGGTDEGIWTIVEQSLQSSLVEVREEQLGVWVVRPIIDTGAGCGWTWLDNSCANNWGYDEDGTSIPIVPVYGNPIDGSMAKVVTPGDALADIESIGTGGSNYTSIDDSQFVVVGVYYRVNTILHLTFFDNPGAETADRGKVPVTAYAVMRQEIEQETVAAKQGGCSAYSMIFNRELFKDDEGNDISEGEYLQINSHLDPSLYDEYPYQLYKNDFDYNIFQTWDFLVWRYDQVGVTSTVHNQGQYCSAVQDEADMNCGSMWPPGTTTDPDIGFMEYQSNDIEGDTELSRGDWVIALNKATVDTADQPLDDHIEAGRAVRVLVYDYEYDGVNINPGYYSHTFGYGDDPENEYTSADEVWMYRVDALAIIKIDEYSHANKWASFKFIRWDTSCGYDLGE